MPIFFAIVANQEKNSYQHDVVLWFLLLNFTFFPVFWNFVKQ